MTKLKLGYFGSPTFSAELLKKLLLEKNQLFEISFVVTQPDKLVGRQQVLSPSPVKLVAQQNNIPVFDTLANIREHIKEADLCIVYAYGFKQLIPIDLLEAPKVRFDIGDRRQSGFINIHPSLLPRYRGSSPIAYPILLGDELTGVSIFVMDEKMDHGPIIAQEQMKIELNDVRTNLERKLSSLGLEMIKKILNPLANGQPPAVKNQNHSLATRSPFMVKQDGFLPYVILRKMLKNEAVTAQELPQIVRVYREKYSSTESRSSKRILYDFWRGMHPWPGLWTHVQPTRLTGELRLKITEMVFNGEALRITKVQLEGKKEVDFLTFQKAYELFS